MNKGIVQCVLDNWKSKDYLQEAIEIMENRWRHANATDMLHVLELLKSSAKQQSNQVALIQLANVIISQEL